MEYLLVVGFSLAIIIPVTALLYGEYQESKTELDLEHLTEVARELVFQAEKLYYQGAPSSTTVEASFPNGVTRAAVVRDLDSGVSSVEFEISRSDVVVYADSKVPLQPTEFGTYPGPHRISLVVDDKMGSDGDVVVLTDR